MREIRMLRSTSAEWTACWTVPGLPRIAPLPACRVLETPIRPTQSGAKRERLGEARTSPSIDGRAKKERILPGGKHAYKFVWGSPVRPKRALIEAPADIANGASLTFEVAAVTAGLRQTKFTVAQSNRAIP